MSRPVRFMSFSFIGSSRCRVRMRRRSRVSLRGLGETGARSPGDPGPDRACVVGGEARLTGQEEDLPECIPRYDVEALARGVREHDEAYPVVARVIEPEVVAEFVDQAEAEHRFRQAISKCDSA